MFRRISSGLLAAAIVATTMTATPATALASEHKERQRVKETTGYVVDRDLPAWCFIFR